MAPEVKKEIALEIAHVLFIDIVGYSKLLINEQRELLEELQQVVRNTEAFREGESTGKLIKLPTGDGMALVFSNTPEAPVKCALEISRALKSRPHLRVRMGVHSGPVSGVLDVTDRENVAGAGINIAQRVMSCGDTGHILISKRLAEDLAQYRHWNDCLHDLGECEVKHGVRIGLVNLYTDEVGNREVPLKLQSEAQRARRQSRTRWMLLGVAGLILISLGVFFWWNGKRLSRAAPSASAIPQKSIAVLPFENFSESKENEFLSDGISEEIINALTKVKALRVASRTSSFAFKGKKQDVGEVGRKLKVNTVLEGSVRKADNRLRVTAELVDVASGYHLWSERYDRQLADVFQIQDQISDNIVRALRVVLGQNERAMIEKAPTGDVQAYEYYLRGRQIQLQLRRSDLEYARRMFERAIEIDPNFARAHAGIADCCSFLYMYLDPNQANLETANASSQKALDLDPASAESHTSRGLALTLRRNFNEARREFDAALKLNPMLYEAHYFYARACFTEGRVEEAVSHYRDAWRVRPEDYQAIFFSVQALMKLGRREEAMEAVHQALRLVDAHLDLNPDDARAWLLSAAALMRLEQREQALERARRALAIDPEDVLVQYNLACVYALAGLTNEALDHLDKAVHNGFRQRGWLENDSSLDSVRGDPRFDKILALLAPK